jgi:signal transduction histidine kinase
MRLINYITCLLLISFVAQAGNVVMINKGDRKYIGSGIEYFMDASRTMQMDDVMKQSFTACLTDIPNFGNIPHNVWMRFSVQSESEKAIYLDLMAPLLNEVEIYQIKNNQPVKLFSGGCTEPFNHKQIASENWLFNLNLTDSVPNTFYIKGHSIFPFQVPVVLAAKEKFVAASQRHYLFWGLYAGVIIFALIYNLFIYFSIREKTYLYYVLYIIGSALFYLGLQGFNYQFLWPNHAVLNLYLPVIICFTNIVITLFAMDFLKITREQKGQFYFGRIMMGVFALLALFNISGQFMPAIGLAQLFSLIICIYYIIIGVLSFKRKVPTAKYFLVAWTFFLVLVFIFIFTINNVIVSNFFTTHCIFIGHMTEVLLLSFALADRINWLKLENESKQQEIIQYLKEREEIQLNANKVLEQKVEERTAALIKNQQQLIESEKMAAVGILASRMSHEIQNPLNFVNNFSEIANELVDSVIKETDVTERDEAAHLLKSNLHKITEHGKIAAGIIHQLQELIRSGTAFKFLEDNKKDFQ